MKSDQGLRADASEEIATARGIHKRDVLITGVPRSGTTWIGRILGKTSGAQFVYEPDKPDTHSPFAVRVTRSLGRFPVLDPGDEAQDYERLWGSLFDRAPNKLSVGTRFVERGRRSIAARLLRRVNAERLKLWLGDAAYPEPLLSRVASRTALPPIRPECRVLVTKSVSAAFSIEWLAARWDVNVVLVSRNPLAVIASWAEIELLGEHPRFRYDRRVQQRYLERWNVRPLPKHSSLLSTVAWEVGLLRAAYDEAATRNPEWLRVSHDDLCGSPDAGFRHIADHCGLLWNSASARFLKETNKPGSGFVINRITKEQPTRWRHKFNTEDVKEIARVLENFPIEGWPNQANDLSPYLR